MTEEKKIKGTLRITIDRKVIEMEAPEPKQARPVPKIEKKEGK